MTTADTGIGSQNGRPNDVATGDDTGVRPDLAGLQPLEIETRTERGSPNALPSAAAGGRGRIAFRQGTTLVFLALVITLLGAGVASGVSLILPEEYAARTQLLYEDEAEQPTGFLREDRTLTTQVELITSRTVLGPVAAASGLTVPQLEEKVHVELIEGSLLIVIEVRDADRQGALRLVEAISDNYQAVARPLDQPGVRAYLERQLTDLRSRLNATPPDSTERAGLRERETELQTQLDELQLDLVGPVPAQVVVAPYSVEEPIFPRPVLAMATGALTGLMIALALVAILARRWTRV